MSVSELETLPLTIEVLVPEPANWIVMSSTFGSVGWSLGAQSSNTSWSCEVRPTASEPLDGSQWTDWARASGASRNPSSTTNNP